MPYQSFRGAFTNEISVLNPKGTIWKKNKLSFIVHFCFGKYSFRFNSFYNGEENTNTITKIFFTFLVLDRKKKHNFIYLKKIFYHKIIFVSQFVLG